ncbi:hypothetical protein FXF51_49900 [Nonomuraea sp. PA05]|nr:hypothetical protein FXF51_49900 [Nonomuraea sp. PA05]
MRGSLGGRGPGIGKVASAPDRNAPDRNAPGNAPGNATGNATGNTTGNATSARPLGGDARSSRYMAGKEPGTFRQPAYCG